MSSQIPYNIDAEKKLLGSCLRQNRDGFSDDEAILRAKAILQINDFYEPKHGTIFLTLCDMAANRQEITIMALADILKRMGNLDKIGGPYYLIELAQTVATSANVEYFAKYVLEHANRRAIVRLCEETKKQASEADSAEEVISDLQSKLHTIFKRIDGSGGLKLISDTLPEALDSINQRSERIQTGRIACDGISTGLTDLDRITGGLGRGRQIILAARPSEGKTSLGLQIAVNATRSGNHVGFFSLEMSKLELTERVLSNVAEINIREALDRQKRTKLLNSGKLAEGWNLYIDDSPLPIEKIESRAKYMALVHDLDLIVIDYLQLIRINQTQKRYEAVTEISSRLKLLAKELNCPILTLSQLSRDIEKRGSNSGNAKPRLSDLRDSGAIEQDADQVIFIHTPDDELKEESGIREIIIAKNRHGPIGQVELYFQKKLTRFIPLTESEKEPF